MASPRRSPTRPPRARRSAKRFDPKAFLTQAGIGRTVHHYSPKQTIFSQGERAEAVFYIQAGRVRLSVLSDQGKEATIALLSSGDFLARGASPRSTHPSGNRYRYYGLFCPEIKRSEMLRTLHLEHGFSDLFVAYVVERHNRTEADLVDQLFNSSEKRLARALLILARFGKERQVRGSDPGHKSGDSGGNDWYNPLASELLHEPIQKNLASLTTTVDCRCIVRFLVLSCTTE